MCLLFAIVYEYLISLNCSFFTFQVQTMTLFITHLRQHGGRLPRLVMVTMSCSHCLILARLSVKFVVCPVSWGYIHVMCVSLLFEDVGGKVFLCFEMHEHNLMMTYQYTHSSDSCVDIFKHI